MEEQKAVCFYHSADLDGHCSGAIVQKAIKAELRGIDYGQEFPFEDIKGRDVVMVDFSLEPFEEMLKLFEVAGTVVWIDHHKSAIEEFEKHFPTREPPVNVFWVLDSSGSIAACQLAWEYYFPNRNVPKTIQLLSKYDAWDLDDDVLRFQYGMKLINNTIPEEQPKMWDKIIASDQAMINHIMKNGLIVQSTLDNENAKALASSAFETKLDGHSVVALNRGHVGSLAFKSWSGYEPEIWVAFYWRGLEKGGWTLSLYSDHSGIDVGKIAKNHGGGGHKGAAGFHCLELPEGFLK